MWSDVVASLLSKGYGCKVCSPGLSCMKEWPHVTPSLELHRGMETKRHMIINQVPHHSAVGGGQHVPLYVFRHGRCSTGSGLSLACLLQALRAPRRGEVFALRFMQRVHCRSDRCETFHGSDRSNQGSDKRRGGTLSLCHSPAVCLTWTTPESSLLRCMLQHHISASIGGIR